MSDHTRWECKNCGSINAWDQWTCGKCSKKWDQYSDRKRWECGKCGKINAWDQWTCGSCRKDYES